MKQRTTRTLLQTVALAGAMAAGTTAFGDYVYEWGDSASGNWSDAANWNCTDTSTNPWTVVDPAEVPEGAVFTERRILTDKTVNFTTVVDEGLPVLVANGTNTFTASASEVEGVVNGIANSSTVLNVAAPWWYTGNSVLVLASGKYQFGAVNVNVDGTNGGTATLTLNGGTLSTTSVTGTGTLAVGENGGTFDNAEAATIATAITGSGTLTKTGTGTLTITGSISAFMGKIAVAAEAGSVIVGDVTIAAGEEVQFGVYTWTGAGTAVEPEEEGGETTYTDTDLWSNVNNWLVNGSIPATLPADDSVVLFPAGDDVTVTVTETGAHTGKMTIERNVTLVAKNVAGSRDLYLNRISGTGKLTLQGASSSRYLRLALGGDYVIDTDLEVKSYIYLSNGSAKTLVINGALSGNGTISCNGNNDAGIAFYGDTSAFSGSYTGGMRNNGNRDNTKFRGNARGSALASWHFCGYGNTLATPFEVDGVTYQFGSLNTYAGEYKRLTLAGRTSTTIEVGAKGDSNVGGTLSNNGNTLRQVGDSTTLNLTLTENYGTVEAKAGTVVIYGTVAPAAAKFAGTGAKIKIARSKTTTTVVTPAVADGPETEEDETVEEVTETTTTTYIPASFKPGFTDAFVGCQYEVTQETTDGVTYDVYTVLTDVATDSAGTTYDSVALAIAAIEADKTGTLTKAITLAKSTAEAVALPLDYTLALNGNTVGSVTGVAGVAVSYNEETGTWTTDDNSEATWQGDAAGAAWDNPENWSSGYVPDAGTAVTFTGNATVFLSGNNTYDCGSIYISRDNATVTFAPVDYNESNWPRVKVYGNIGAHGNCVLKLYRCGIDNGTTERVTVRPTLQFYNTTGDSWVTGNFQLQASLEGTGEFRVYSGTLDFASGSGITVNDGSTVDFRNYYPTFEGRSGTLSSTGVNGDGRIIVHALPTSSALTYFQNAFKNDERWSGTCELAGISIGNIDAANYGNANSSVCFNGVSGYLRYSANSTTEVGKVKTIEIGANGLTLNNGFTSGTFGYIIAADITGSGPIHFGTRHNDASVGQYFLTGSLDGFTGAIDFGSLTAYRPAVIIKDSNTYAPAVNDYGQIIVAAERTVTVSGAWNAPGGIVVLGKVNVASTGSLTSTNGLCGDGTVAYAAIPSTAPGCCAGGTSSGTNREIPAWTGTVVLPSRTGSGSVALAGLGRTGSKIVVNGITGTDANSIYLSDASAINGTVELKGDVKFTNGSTGANYTFAEVTGTGNMFLSATGSTGSPYYTYTFTKLTDYTGEINAVKTSDSKYAALAIGTVAVSEVVPGTPVVKLAANSNLTTDPAAIAVEVGGEATVDKLFKADDGNLYVAVASVTVTPEEGDPVTTPFATYEAAAAFADENSVTEFAVLFGDGAVNGWNYDSEAGTLTKNTTAIARIGTTQYDTLAAAFEDATAGDTVVLFGASAENVTVGEGQTLVVEGAYTGTLSGSGTVDAKVVTTPAGFSSWTGTFVMNWNTSAATSGTAWVLDNYGNDGSTVVIAQPIAHGYLKKVGSNAAPSIAPAVYLKANVNLDNGYAGSSQATTFSQLGADEGVTFSFRYLAGAVAKDATYYTITKLKDFAGAFVLNPYNQVTVESVELAATPAFGTKVVSATVAGTASLTGKIADGYPLVAKADGLYFDPVAQVGEAYYNTLAEAITAANGATVALVKSTEEGVVVAAGQTVVIKFGEYSTGDITAATDYVLNTSWDDATKTGTYTTTAVAAYLIVGETVTPYTVAYTALTDFIASATGSTLRFVGTNPFADTPVPCTTYDAATLTYTKLAAVAQIGTGPSAIQYPTLAEACTAAEQYGYGTVTLLVAIGDMTVPDGWDYNTPAASETEFGTLTKEMTVTYNVWFVDTDGSTTLAAMQTVESGATATKPAEDPVKEGYTFVAWTLGGTAYDFTTPVTSTITLMASWVSNTYTVPAEAALGEGGTLTVPEGTVAIKIGSYDVTAGFTVSGTTATLVAPVLAETVAEADDAFVVGTSDVTLNATLVPGLYYGVGSATSLNELARPAALTQFTGENGDACKKVTKPEGDKGFFRLYVDIKE